MGLRKFRVVHDCKLRNRFGIPLHSFKVGEEVEIDDEHEVQRLLNARCLIPVKEENVETAVVIPMERQIRRRRRA